MRKGTSYFAKKAFSTCFFYKNMAILLLNQNKNAKFVSRNA